MLEGSATASLVPNNVAEVITSIPDNTVSSQPGIQDTTSAELPSDSSSVTSSLPTPIATSTTSAQSSTQPSPAIVATPVTIHTPKLITHTIAAAGKYSQAIDVSGEGNHKYGTQIAWYFTSSMDVGFSVTVDGEKIKPPSRCLTSRGLYTTKPNTKCHVVFEWDNSFSWITLKDINYEIVVRTPEEVEKIMEAELQAEAKRREKPDSPITTATTSTTTSTATTTTPIATTAPTTHEPSGVQETHQAEEKTQEGEVERQEAAKQEVATQEAVKQEVATQEAVKQEVATQEAAKQDATQEAEQQEAEQRRVKQHDAEENKETLSRLVHQFRDSFLLQQQEWSEARKKVELKMKEKLDALESMYKQEQQECEAQISQHQSFVHTQRQELLAKAEAFPELRELLSGLDMN